MTTQKKRIMLAATLAAACAFPFANARAQEFGSNTPYYEDDSWYDVSEWFDGNDYNPTDEAIGRWDDEVFTFAENATSSDNDNFLNLGYADYGYYEDTDSDWFYDYYDDGYGYWDDEYYSTYYDVDDDGVYDAYSLYSDTDGDGFYEDFDYYSFSSDTEGQSQSMSQAKDRQKQMKSTKQQLSGNIQEVKTADVRDREHQIVLVEQSNGNSMLVDLGPKQSKSQLRSGDQLNVRGHVFNVGDKKVLIASEAATKDGTINIDRSGRQYQGTIQSTKTVSVQGTQRTLAKVKTANNKTMLVDVGPTQKLDRNLNQGAQITVRGVPVKVKDRIVLMADQVMKDGKKMQIDRRVSKTN